MTDAKANTFVPNTPPKNLADFYHFYWHLLLKRMDKTKQAELLGNLNRKPIIVRGKPVEYTDVNCFVKAVILEAETQYEVKVQKQIKEQSNNELAKAPAESPNPS